MKARVEALVSKSFPFKSYKLLVPVSKQPEGALSTDPIRRGTAGSRELGRALRVCAIIKSDTHMHMFKYSGWMTYVHADALIN